MLQVSSLSKGFGQQTLFEDISFALGGAHRVGLVGPNGCGKSTLLRILAGLEAADAGTVRMPRETRVGYLPQRQDTVDRTTVCAFLDAESWCVRRALARVGLPPALADRPIDTLSGGEHTRVHLARVALLDDADLLLLDEPTNNLDLGALEWLEEYLEGLSATVLVVSHDRRFLDRVTDRTLVLDPVSRQLADYGGNYSWSMQRRAEDRERQWREYRAQQDVVRRLEGDIRATKQQALSTELSTVNDFLRGKAKKVAAKAKAREARLNKLLDQENKKEKPRDFERMRLAIAGRDLHRAILLEARDVTYDPVPGAPSGPILTAVDVNLRAGMRVVVLGPNGSGKTTLVRLLLGDLPPTAGTVRRRQDLEIGYLPQLQETLPDDRTVLAHFLDLLPRHRPRRAAEARTFLHRFLFTGGDAFKAIGSLSSGERARLLLAGVMARGADILVLDEPTNHLDAPTLERLEEALQDFGGAMLAVTHDRHFAQALGPHQIWEVEGGRVTVRDSGDIPDASGGRP